MALLQYQTPVTAENLPALAASVFTFRSRLRRKRVSAVVCQVLAFFLHTPMMILTLYSLLKEYVGPDAAATLERLPYLDRAADLFLRVIPEGLKLERVFPADVLDALPIPTILCLLAAFLLPLLASLLVTLLFRLFWPRGTVNPLQDEKDPSALLSSLRGVVQDMTRWQRRGRIALWSFLSALATAAVSARDLIACADRILSFDHPIVPFLALLAVFSTLQLVSGSADQMLDRCFFLDTRWNGTRLMNDLNACPIESVKTISTDP